MLRQSRYQFFVSSAVVGTVLFTVVPIRAESNPALSGDTSVSKPVLSQPAPISNQPAAGVVDLPAAPVSDRAEIQFVSDPLENRRPFGLMSQVTSVSQLTDVRPTDWAFQALQSLVERYGCIVGFPDKTYRGSQALTRYEFAAGLNACLDRINDTTWKVTSREK